jgi:hypothetical protein
MQISGNVSFTGNWAIAAPVVSNVVANTSTTYRIVESSNVIYEPNGNIIYTVTTTYGSNTTLYWEIYLYPESQANSVSMPYMNFSGNILTGNFNLTSNVGTFGILARNNDANFGNTITWLVKVKTGSTSGPNVATSNVFTYVILN